MLLFLLDPAVAHRLVYPGAQARGRSGGALLQARDFCAVFLVVELFRKDRCAFGRDLAKPQTLKSEATVTVKEVLDCSDMQEF
ncbi:MAG: hypothetical protein ACREJM_03885, partial [Candidatus Saccharimonadales bacterium]